MPSLSLRTAFRVCCCVMFFAAGNVCLAAQWPDDAARVQTLRLLSGTATNELITMAAGKTAWLFYGMEVTTHRTESNRITLAINGPPDSYLGAGLAVAIDARGYFLTAAHLLASPPPFTVVFHDGSAVRSAPARIVAKIPRRSKNGRAPDLASTLDLALLHAADVQLANVFAWAEIKPKPRRDSVVVQLGEAKGRFSDTSDFIRFSAVAGRLKKLITLRSGGAVTQSDTPGRPGDSGGPLLNTKGELLGITSGLDVRLFGIPLATASRPDPGWLHDTIENDQRCPPSPVTNTVVQNGGEPGYVEIRFAPRGI